MGHNVIWEQRMRTYMTSTIQYMICFARRRPKWVVFGHAGAKSRLKQENGKQIKQQGNVVDTYNRFWAVTFILQGSVAELLRFRPVNYCF